MFMRCVSELVIESREVSEPLLHRGLEKMPIQSFKSMLTQTVQLEPIPSVPWLTDQLMWLFHMLMMRF